jgi:hypothetical protein
MPFVSPAESLHEMVASTSSLLAVLKLFLIPVGGGIPAGVLLARANGLAWPVTTLIYLVSDLLLALAFEPVLRLLATLGSRIPFLANLCATVRARSVTHMSGTSAGPLTLVIIAFGMDPMTGRATAMAAGHGFIAGWAIAVAGDMLYLAVIALTTLRLNRYFKDPDSTMMVVLGLMFIVPILVRKFRSRFNSYRTVSASASAATTNGSP